jgi:hypothetical protein
MKFGAPLGGQPPRDKEYESADLKNQSEHTPKRRKRSVTGTLWGEGWGGIHDAD